tara:strand:+ start:455 stop:637 length:183 start_codon:yes stop_codon:yes gene_type:complete
MVYIKKTKYGQAEIAAERIGYNSKAKRAFAQTGSKIVIGGSEIPLDHLSFKVLFASGGNS